LTFAIARSTTVLALAFPRGADVITRIQFGIAKIDH